MNNADRERIIKMIKNWEEIQSEIAERNIKESDILNDRFIQWAITTPVYNIGEHVSNLSKEFKDEHRDIPWTKISGLRNRLVHNYEDTNWSIIVRVIYDDMPEFIENLKSIIIN